MSETDERAKALHVIAAYSRWRKRVAMGVRTKQRAILDAYRAGYAQAEADAAGKEQGNEHDRLRLLNIVLAAREWVAASEGAAVYPDEVAQAVNRYNEACSALMKAVRAK